MALLLVVGIAAVTLLVPNGNTGSRDEPVAPADLAPARAKAALRPCPAPEPGAAPAMLRDVRAICLGDGTEVDVGAALAGRPALINVWASWCQPCRDELPVLEAYAASPVRCRCWACRCSPRPRTD